MKRMIRTLPLLLTLGLGACLENEEEIVVHEDGSVEVRIAAEGDLADLSNGYSVPLGAGWELTSEDAMTWASLVGPDTGSLEVQTRIREVEWPEDESTESEKVRLEATRRFSSVDEMPQWYAPAAEPYQTAYLRRTTDLEVRAAGGRKVYVFERVFHRRDWGERNMFGQALENVPEELRETFEAFSEERPPTPEEWVVLTEAVRLAFEDAAELFANDALLGLYTKGDASLRPGAVAPILLDVREAAGAVVTTEKLVAIWDSTYRETDGRSDLDEEEEEARLVRELEEGMQQSVRDVLGSSLHREGVSQAACNAVLYGLEWCFTAYAQSDDIQDEEFEVTVKLPGILVSGNYDDDEEDAASWSFTGEDLQDQDVVLRAVSVLE